MMGLLNKSFHGFQINYISSKVKLLLTSAKIIALISLFELLLRNGIVNLSKKFIFPGYH